MSKTRILQVWDDECSLKRERPRSSEILAVANWCISLEARNLASSEIPQHNTFP